MVSGRQRAAFHWRRLGSDKKTWPTQWWQSCSHIRTWMVLITVHSQLVLVKFFEAGDLAQSHTTDRASKWCTVWSLSLHSRALMAPTPLTPLQANVWQSHQAAHLTTRPAATANVKMTTSPNSHILLQKQLSQLKTETKWAICLHLESLATVFGTVLWSEYTCKCCNTCLKYPLFYSHIYAEEEMEDSLRGILSQCNYFSIFFFSG